MVGECAKDLGYRDRRVLGNEAKGRCLGQTDEPTVFDADSLGKEEHGAAVRSPALEKLDRDNGK
jgi:hypothetical protein